MSLSEAAAGARELAGFLEQLNRDLDAYAAHAAETAQRSRNSLTQIRDDAQAAETVLRRIGDQDFMGKQQAFMKDWRQQVEDWNREMAESADRGRVELTEMKGNLDGILDGFVKMAHQGDLVRDQMRDLAEAANGSFDTVKDLTAMLEKLASQDATGSLRNALAEFESGKLNVEDFLRKISDMVANLRVADTATQGFLGTSLQPMLNMFASLAQRLRELPSGDATAAAQQGGGQTEAGIGGSAGFSATAGSSSTGWNQTGRTSSGGVTFGNDGGQSRSLVASAINLGAGGRTVAERARILRELQDQIRRIRR